MRFVRFEARGHEAQNVGRMSSGWDQVFLLTSSLLLRFLRGFLSLFGFALGFEFFPLPPLPLLLLGLAPLALFFSGLSFLLLPFHFFSLLLFS